MKLGIKAKILGATGLVVMISLMLSGFSAYYYFQKIFKEKAIKDDVTKIDQIAQQMEYQIDDIRKYATSMIIIPEVQDFIKQNRYSSYYDQLINARKALGLMVNQLFLREYIHSAAVITSNGSVWYTDLHTMPHDYFKSKLREDWYQRYLARKDQFYFSDPYNISNYSRGTASKNVISYIVQLHDVDQPDKVCGRLFLNVFLDHFAKNILINSKEYDAFYWINKPLLQRVVEFRDAKILDKLSAWTPAWYASFGQDKYIFAGCAIWTPQYVIQPNDPNGKGNWGLMRAPGGNFSWGGTTLGISKQCKHKAAAWEFVNFATLSVDGAKAAHEVGFLTSYKAAYKDPEFASIKNEWFGGQDIGKYWINEVAPNIKIRPMTKYDNVIKDSLDLIVTSLNNDSKMTVADALPKLIQEIKNRAPELTVK